MADIPAVYTPVPQAPSPGFSRQALPEGGAQAGSQFLAGIEGIFDAYNRNKLAQQQIQGASLANQAQDFSNQATQANYRLGMFGLSPSDVNQGFGKLMNPDSYAPPAAPLIQGANGSLYGSPTQGQTVIPGQSIPTDSKQNGMGPAPGILAMPQPQLQPQQGPQGPQMGGPQGTMVGPDGQPMPPNPVPQGLSQGQPGDSPTLATLRNVLQIRGHTAQLQAAQEQANLSKTGSEAAKSGAEARKTNVLTDLISGNGDSMKLLADRIQAGQEDPSLSGLGKGEVQGEVRLAVGLELARRGANTTQLQASYDAAQKRASSQAGVQGDKGQTLGAAAGTLEDILKQASPLASQLNDSDWQAVNQAFTQGKAIRNNPKAQEFLTLMTEAQGKYGTVLAQGNSAGQSEKEDAHKAISLGLNKEGFAGMQNGVTFAANSTVKRLTGQGFNEAAPKITNTPANNWSGGTTHVYADGTKAQWNGAAWVKAQ